uniref:Reverse transcriptase zinc-binding domain-containing protein n=1 Tax=Cannabis sativa TaxID=3483 RepID=A0A803QEC9_CANSA
MSSLGWGQASGSSGTSRWWKLLWQLNLPPKIKNFVWKASLNFIPSYANLTRHDRNLSSSLPLAGVFGTGETPLYVIINSSPTIWLVLGAMDYLWKYQDANIGGLASMGPSSNNVGNEKSSIEIDLVLGEFNIFVDDGIRYEDREIGMGALVYNHTEHVLFLSAGTRP